MRTGGQCTESRESGPKARISAQARARLEVIAEQLGRGVFPEVLNRGVVVPNQSPVLPKTMGTEHQHEVRRERSPAPSGAWQGPRAQGASRAPSQSGGTRAPGEAASFIIPDRRDQYEREISGLSDAYPGAQVWEQSAGLWLKTTSSLLPELELRADFLTCLQFEPFPIYRSWAFWSDIGWIGPRHTNFPDGSICAFDLRDSTWEIGDPLVELLDIYTLWALRHLHLQVFGRWPGAQSVANAYERLWEFRDNELCGCGRIPHKTYVDCCKSSDLLRPVVREAIAFSLPRFGGLRAPPKEVADFYYGMAIPPLLSKIFPRITVPEYDYQLLPIRNSRFNLHHQ